MFSIFFSSERIVFQYRHQLLLITALWPLDSAEENKKTYMLLIRSTLYEFQRILKGICTIGNIYLLIPSSIPYNHYIASLVKKPCIFSVFPQLQLVAIMWYFTTAIIKVHSLRRENKLKKLSISQIHTERMNMQIEMMYGVVNVC